MESNYIKRKKQLAWDTLSESNLSDETLIQRAINFGDINFIKHVQNNLGIQKFIQILKNSRGLSKKAVNYWCLVLGIDRNQTKTFSRDYPTVWEPFR